MIFASQIQSLHYDIEKRRVVGSSAQKQIARFSKLIK